MLIGIIVLLLLFRHAKGIGKALHFKGTGMVLLSIQCVLTLLLMVGREGRSDSYVIDLDATDVDATALDADNDDAEGSDDHAVVLEAHHYEYLYSVHADPVVVV